VIDAAGGGPSGIGLAEVSTDDLLQLASGLGSGQLRAPLSRTQLTHRGFSHLLDALEPYLSLDHAALLLLIDAVLAERRHRVHVDIHQLHERLKQTLRSEQRKSRLEPLNRARADGVAPYADAVLGLFVELFWPFDGPRPEIYYGPRTADDQSFASLHAKCIVVDHEQTLITSANFTDRGQNRNIEVGVLIRDPLFAQSLEQQWFNLVSAGAVARWAS
jgi:phosphatidylserine/phosphatidylglycerophosphate/cardiolipin synthase-like enzyme